MACSDVLHTEYKLKEAQLIRTCYRKQILGRRCFEAPGLNSRSFIKTHMEVFVLMENERKKMCKSHFIMSPKDLKVELGGHGWKEGKTHA